jgi:hypothetical protein
MDARRALGMPVEIVLHNDVIHLAADAECVPIHNGA